MIVTIERFLEAWEKYSPSKIEEFYFKHFSKSAKSNKTGWIVFFMLLVPFLGGYLGTILNLSRDFIGSFTITFSVMITLFAIPWIYTWHKNNRRIKKITKYLGCTLEEWNEAVSKWKHLLK